jgi:uridine phosphorylase
MLDRLSAFRSGEDRITNVEMETAALFHLGSVFGHRMASVSALLANRASGQTSADPEKTVKRLIDQSLDVLF